MQTECRQNADRMQTINKQEWKNEEWKKRNTNITIYSNDSFEMSVTKEFFSNLSNNPKVQYQISRDEKYFHKQSDIIRLLKNNDWLTEEQIIYIVRFIWEDDFWKDQILSLSKLRKKDKDWTPYWLVIADKIRQEKENSSNVII